VVTKVDVHSSTSVFRDACLWEELTFRGIEDESTLGETIEYDAIKLGLTDQQRYQRLTTGAGSTHLLLDQNTARTTKVRHEKPQVRCTSVQECEKKGLRLIRRENW
jgi:hypothetical protein